jgi:hypothetical protein
MARPVKNYCDYFTHDRDMRNHRKVKAIRTKFGLPGYAMWNMILEHLTGSDGNEFENSTIEFELMAGDFGVSVTEIREVVDYAMNLELLFEKDGFIHSESLDERLAAVYEKRKVNKSKSKKQLRVNGKFVKDNPADAVVSVTDKPQSKVNKSKVNKSKVNKSKVKEPETNLLWFLKYYHAPFDTYKKAFNGQSTTEDFFNLWKKFIDLIYEKKFEEIFNCKFVNPHDFEKLITKEHFTSDKWEGTLKDLLATGIKAEHNLFFRIPKFMEYGNERKKRGSNNAVGVVGKSIEFDKP